MRTLLIETSTTEGEVALADERGLVAIRRLSSERKHARDLVPFLRELFLETGWKPRELTALFLDLGPGSYTGLRVGVATAKSLAYATGASVVGVDVMHVLAEGAPPRAADVHVIVDAQQSSVYAAAFRRASREAAPIMVGDIGILPAAEWAAGLRPGSFVTGPGLSTAKVLPAGCQVASESERLPRAEHLWKVARRLWEAGRREDFWTLEPLYLRPSSAEAKLRGQESGKRKAPETGG